MADPKLKRAVAIIHNLFVRKPTIRLNSRERSAWTAICREILGTGDTDKDDIDENAEDFDESGTDLTHIFHIDARIDGANERIGALEADVMHLKKLIVEVGKKCQK